MWPTQVAGEAITDRDVPASDVLPDLSATRIIPAVRQDDRDLVIQLFDDLRPHPGGSVYDTLFAENGMPPPAVIRGMLAPVVPGAKLLDLGRSNALPAAWFRLPSGATLALSVGTVGGPEVRARLYPRGARPLGADRENPTERAIVDAIESITELGWPRAEVRFEDDRITVTIEVAALRKRRVDIAAWESYRAPTVSARGDEYGEPTNRARWADRVLDGLDPEQIETAITDTVAQIKRARAFDLLAQARVQERAAHNLLVVAQAWRRIAVVHAIHTGGLTQQEVGDVLRLTKQRVGQIDGSFMSTPTAERMPLWPVDAELTQGVMPPPAVTRRRRRGDGPDRAGAGRFLTSGRAAQLPRPPGEVAQRLRTVGGVQQPGTGGRRECVHQRLDECSVVEYVHQRHDAGPVRPGDRQRRGRPGREPAAPDLDTTVGRAGHRVGQGVALAGPEPVPGAALVIVRLTQRNPGERSVLGQAPQRLDLGGPHPHREREPVRQRRSAEMLELVVDGEHVDGRTAGRDREPDLPARPGHDEDATDERRADSRQRCRNDGTERGAQQRVLRQRLDPALERPCVDRGDVAGRERPDDTAHRPPSGALQVLITPSMAPDTRTGQDSPTRAAP